MSGLNFKRESTSTIPAQSNRRNGEKYSKVRKSDPNTCNVYSILASMLEEQKEHQYSRFADSYVKYRKVVAEWMMDVCEYFGLHPTTTHAAIAYLDRLQPSDKFSRYEWQMLAICCILIASKYNESEEDVPDLRTLEEITQQPIPNETVLNYELWALKKMGWKLNARTPLAFVASYIVAGVTTTNDVCWDSANNTKYTNEELDVRLGEELYSMASFCMLQAELKHFKASDLASGMLYFVRRAMGVVPIWPQELSSLTKVGASSRELLEIVRVFEDMLLPSPSPPESLSPSRPAESSVQATDAVLRRSQEQSSSQARTNGDMVTTPVSTPHTVRTSREYATGLVPVISVSSVSETDALALDRDAVRQHASPQSTADMLASPEEKDILKGTAFYEKGDPLRPNGHGAERYPPIVAAIPMDSLRHTAEA